jgi:hypothetical protein
MIITAQNLDRLVLDDDAFPLCERDVSQAIEF